VSVPLTAKEFRVGYIDLDRIIAKYEAASEAQKQLAAEIAKYQAKADSLQREYQQAQEEYESQQLTLSEEGKRAKLAEVEQRKRRYDSYLNEVYGTGGKIDQKNQELIAPIVEQIDTVVCQLAQEEGIALVLDATKAGIIYAASGLDLTELVIEELNRQYAPVTPAGPVTFYYAVMPIAEVNDLARQEQVGPKIRALVYELVQNRPKIKLVANAKVDNTIQERGLTAQQLVLEKVLDVARAVNADYAIFGTCSKHERKTAFELSIVDVRLGTLVATKTAEADRDDLLRERIGAAVQTLLSSIERP